MSRLSATQLAVLRYLGTVSEAPTNVILREVGKETGRRATRATVQSLVQQGLIYELPDHPGVFAVEAAGEPCAHHRHQIEGYQTWHEDSAQRLARGEEQVRCPACRFWYWPHELGTP